MFVTSAMAQDTTTPAAPAMGATDLLIQFAPILLLVVIFWLLIFRPQQKRMKDHRALIAAIKKGDEVMTAGGIVGKVIKAHESSPTVEVEIADNVRVQIARGQNAGDLGIGSQKRCEVGCLPIAPHGVPLHPLVGLLARQAPARQFQEHGPGKDDATGSGQVLPHAVRMNDQAVHDVREAAQHVIEGDEAVRQDDALHGGV